MLNIKFTLSSGGGLARNIWHMTEIAAFTVKSASSTNTGLACYGYIKQSTMIDKLSLRLGGGRVLCHNDVKRDTNPFVNTPWSN